METFELLEDVDHADWKTASVHPDRWPTLKKGTHVTLLERWSNYYGNWLKVQGPNGSKYDISPAKVKPVAPVVGSPKIQLKLYDVTGKRERVEEVFLESRNIIDANLFFSHIVEQVKAGPK